MTTQVIAQKQDFRVLTRCPNTGEQVWGHSLVHLSIVGCKAVWWYCPTCEGWHIMIIDEEEELEGEY